MPENLKKLSDEELVEKVKEGCESSACELYNRYRDEVFAYIRKKFPNVLEPEDVLQKVFENLFANIQRIEQGREFRPYLYSIVNHAALDRWYREKREREKKTSLDDAGPEGDGPTALDTIPGEKGDFLKGLLLEEVKKSLLEAIWELDNDSYINTLFCRYFLQMSEKSIADTFARNLQTVKSDLRRGTACLRKLFKDLSGYDEDTITGAVTAGGRDIMERMSRLDSRTKRAVELKILQDKTIGEVARELSCSEKEARRLVVTGLTTLFREGLRMFEYAITTAIPLYVMEKEKTDKKLDDEFSEYVGLVMESLRFRGIPMEPLSAMRAPEEEEPVKRFAKAVIMLLSAAEGKTDYEPGLSNFISLKLAEKGMSNDSLMERLGMDEEELSGLLNDRKKPDEKIIEKLAGILDAPAAKLKSLSSLTIDRCYPGMSSRSVPGKNMEEFDRRMKNKIRSILKTEK